SISPFRGRRHMKDFAGRIAVVTGGSSGMGQELVRQLVAEACNVAMCDVSEQGMAETRRLCEAAGMPQGLRVTAHLADVSDAAQVERFRDVSEQGMAETRRLCEAAGMPQGLRVTAHLADVSDAAQVERFRDEVAERHGTDKIHLLFNNAGIGGGGEPFVPSPPGKGEEDNVFYLGGVHSCS